MAGNMNNVYASGTSNSNTSNNRMNNRMPGMQNMKYEIANEIGVNLKQGYNGDLTSRQTGYVGGYMVKRMIEQVERSMSGSAGTTK
jgi:hypothetical protein